MDMWKRVKVTDCLLGLTPPNTEKICLFPSEKPEIRHRLKMWQFRLKTEAKLLEERKVKSFASLKIFV